MSAHAAIWAVIPTYNESGALESVVRQVLGFVDQVVIVDDGSVDGSALHLAGPSVTVLRHPINLGQGAALQTGIRYAIDGGAEYIATLDADGQHDPADIPRALKLLRASRALVALGSRFKGAVININPSRRWVLKLAVVFTRWTTGLDVTDTHNGFRILHVAAARQLRIRQNRMAHASEILEILAREQIPYIEVPVTIRYTDYSKKKGQTNLGAVHILIDLLLQRLGR